VPKKETTEKPILFSGEMVKAILAGRKTVTRRVCDPQPALIDGLWHVLYPWGEGGHGIYETEAELRKEYDRLLLRRGIQAGDRLWVREAWAPCDDLADGVERADPVCIWYAADKTALRWETGADGKPEPVKLDTFAWREPKRLRPSIFMPRFAARLTLEVVSVRAERLQEIFETDAAAELGLEEMLEGLWTGLPGDYPDTRDPVAHFSEAWDRINGKRAPWEQNPWVWRIEFKRVEGGAR
jgi:hypothetical protein